ncbi:DNA ligase D, 3'-phosphoesterase domain-containing protein [Saccharomonospora viridis]|jgi:DNA ligase D-like protein (predicted 3'-phosphoesterase)|uniref:DNA ligase D 3'-phosphoesterase domain-containing protein n=3 Tax=Saccharomonospora viridis TaxID=1852 RepID=C7MSF2_SACVD|nr:hypothetical protein Svir_01780 [Saccharomonospora viridis DSM 43017]SFP18270.1 DNA ligase D, 3'-phosphoesterase domain-containing protein [Saccharomonospora viridis]
MFTDMANRDALGIAPATPHLRCSVRARGPVEAHHPRSRYVIERQGVSGPHYDFRLLLGDVAACWAIPAEPSLTPGDKRLAIRSDSPSPASSETDPAAVWDMGTVANLGELSWEHALAEGQLSLRLSGERIHGVFVMVRAHRGSDQEQWLLITKGTDVEVGDLTPYRTGSPFVAGPTKDAG